MRHPYLFADFPHFLHGGDYNPDQWLRWPDIIDEDFRLMPLAGCNVFSVGIFAWAALEPEEGTYTMDWLGEILDRLHANGHKALLATPSGGKPNWLAHTYPEVRRVDGNGRRQPQKGRHNHCPTSPIYRQKVAAINGELARRFGDHPAVLAWHISNEYSGQCFCDLCLDAFRVWLHERYGDLDTLNDAWWSRFWSHTYTDWSQIDPCDNGTDGLQLDWKRFVTHQTRQFMEAEIAAVRSGGSQLPVTTNFMGRFRGLDYHSLCEPLDFVANDAYPLYQHQPEMMDEVVRFGFVHELMRSLKGKPFLQMECTPSSTNWFATPKLKDPGMHRLEMLQAIGHGADGTLYFQWRKGRGSSEKFHGAVVDHEGSEHTRVFQEVASYGRCLEAIQEVLGTSSDARVALIHDWEALWALDGSTGPGHEPGVTGKRYEETLCDHYRPFWARGIAVDIINRLADFSPYELLIMPMCFMVEEATANRLRTFVERGGTLVATYLSGIVDNTSNCHLGGWPGAGLRELFGVWAEEIDVLGPHDTLQIVSADGNALGLSGTFAGKRYCDVLHNESAEVVATTAGQFYAGSPAVTLNEVGKGRAIYIAARGDRAFQDDLMSALCADLGITGPLATPVDMVSVIRRVGEHHDYLFVLNFSRESRRVEIPGDLIDLESGDSLANTLPLAGLESRVLKRTPPARH